jgi:very-short-patch-repair endonuclease
MSAFGIVSVEQSLVQAAICLGPEAFFAAFESAWNQNLIDRRARSEVRAALPARFRWLVDIARPDAQSGLESILRLRLHRLGIFLESQIWIDGVGRVDFVLDGCIILEVDGRENHEGPSLRRRDLRRDAAAAVRGYETLRFDYALVIHDWPIVEAAILARLVTARSTGRSPASVGRTRV